MNRLFYIIILCSCALCSCSRLDLAGVYDTVLVDVPTTYSGIRVESCIEVRYSPDCTETSVEADVNLIPYVEIYQKGQVLVISLADGLRLDDAWWNDLRVVVTLPEKERLESVELTGASAFISEVPVTGDRFIVDASGASRFTGEITAGKLDMKLSGASSFECGSLRCEQLELNASGASHASISGKVDLCSLSLSGASSLEGISEDRPFSLDIDYCVGSLAGASTAWFRCDGTVSCSLSGASSIHYAGSADDSGSHVSADGSGIFRETR